MPTWFGYETSAEKAARELELQQRKIIDTARVANVTHDKEDKDRVREYRRKQAESLKAKKQEAEKLLQIKNAARSLAEQQEVQTVWNFLGNNTKAPRPELIQRLRNGEKDQNTVDLIHQKMTKKPKITPPAEHRDPLNQSFEEKYPKSAAFFSGWEARKKQHVEAFHQKAESEKMDYKDRDPSKLRQSIRI